MKKILLLSLLLSHSLFGSTFEELKVEIDDLKAALRLASTKAEKSEVYYKLALASLADQETDQAFQYFLTALTSAKAQPTPHLSEEEKCVYDEALDYYLKQNGVDPERVAQEMLERYEKIAEAHPEFTHLNFLISSSYANLGKYALFFEKFYHSYPKMMHTFLAYKTQGILYLRLSQRSRSEKMRRGFQKEALHHLKCALDQNPNDSSLYKVLIFLVKDEKNDASVLSYLRKMVEHQPHIPRGDIFFYVREAVELGEYAIGQRVIDQARSIYDYSRGIVAAQEYLNQHKG